MNKINEIKKKIGIDRLEKDLNINNKLNESTISVNGETLKFSNDSVDPNSFSGIEFDFESDLNRCVRSAINSKNKIPISNVTSKQMDFYEEVNFYFKGMGHKEASPFDIKIALINIINGDS